jgi:hypothetical protein
MVEENMEMGRIRNPPGTHILPCLERKDTGPVMDIGMIELPVNILTSRSPENSFG